MIGLIATIENFPTYPTTYEIDIYNLHNINFDHFSRKNMDTISWGVISNGGTIEFIDTSGIVIDAVNEGKVKSSREVKIYLKNYSNSQSQLLSTLKLSKAKYNKDKKLITLELKDNLIRTQNIEISTLDRDLFFVRYDGKELYKLLYRICYDDYGIPMRTYEELDDDTQNYLLSCIFPNTYISKGTLWSILNKFAVATRTQIYVDNEGFVTCKRKGGI